MNMTQAEMAKRLGVTAPAVNKWENGNSLPDITLLSPIARLLNISVDTLLSHDRQLSEAEAHLLLAEAQKKLKVESFDDVFEWVRQRIIEYPTCHILILWMAALLDNQRKMCEMPNAEKYDDYILNCYQCVLESDDPALKNAAAESLYHFYINKEEYIQAEQYITCFSPENPERKRKQAMIYSRTGRREDAYKMYEELLYAGYQSLNMTLNSINLLAIEDNDLVKAHRIIEKMQIMANLFEFGEYHAVSPALELATLEKNEAETLRIMERMLTNLESIYAFTKSPLYSHMTFNEPDSSFISEVREDLMNGFRDEETYAFLKGNQRWRKLVGLE